MNVETLNPREDLQKNQRKIINRKYKLFFKKLSRQTCTKTFAKAQKQFFLQVSGNLSAQQIRLMHFSLDNTAGKSFQF